MKPNHSHTSSSTLPAQFETGRLLALLEAQKLGLEMILDDAPLPDVLAHLARTVEQLADNDVVASVLLLDDDNRLRRGAAPNLPEDYQRAIDGIPMDINIGTCCKAAATGEVVVTTDFRSDCGWAGLRELPLALGLLAAWSLPIKDRHGRVLGTFGTYFRECRAPLPQEIQTVEILAPTAAIAIERHRRELERTASARDMVTLADNIQQLVWMTNAEGQPVWLNRRWFEYTGCDLDFLKSTERWRLVHPEHRERVFGHRSACLKAGVICEDMYPLLGADGNYRWFIVRLVPVHDADGHITQWFGTKTDVSDVRSAHEALREADQRKDHFLAVLAHELRNPLAPLASALDVMRTEYADTEVYARLGDLLQRQVGQLARLVDDLMDVSRLTRGKVELRREPIDLRDVLQNAVETSRPILDAARHVLSITLPDQSLPLSGDFVRLTQVFANLLNNAARYTPDGGAIAVTAAPASGADSVLVSVRDNGCGIAPHQLATIFEWFCQGDAVEQHGGGLGVGLTLARELVVMHGGRIEAHSDGVGCGAEFRVYLPLSAAVAKTATAVAMPPQKLPFRILIADDNQDAADSLGMLLRGLGATTEVVYNGQAALEAIARNRPEIVVLDLGMGGLDGYETGRRIRAQPALNDVSLVALTGWDQPDIRARTTAIGFDRHLVKPVDFQRLQSELIRLRSAPHQD